MRRMTFLNVLLAGAMALLTLAPALPVKPVVTNEFEDTITD